MSKTVNINMSIDDLYQIRRDCLVNDDKETVFFCLKAGKLVKTLSYDEGFSCSKKEFISFDVIEYHNIESTIIYTKNTNSCVEVEEVEEVEEPKRTIYHNENSDWYLINDNYKDAETIEEEGIDLAQYKIVKIESSETGNNEVDDSFGAWECQDGVWFLEEEGCFKRFESLEKLIEQYEFDKDLREEEVEYYDFNTNVDYDEFI